MVNLTRVLRHIEVEMGYRFIDLEVSERDIVENLKDETLRTFSKKFPFRVRHFIHAGRDKVMGFHNRYYIKTDLDVLSVAKASSNASYGITGDLVYVSGVGNVADFVNHSLLADLVSMVQVPNTFHYYDEDQTIELNPGGYSSGTKILIQINCIHKDDFSTIPTNMEDEFSNLAALDTMRMLYPLRNRFANLQTPFGGIEQFVEKLADAEGKREELLEKWRRNYYKSPKRQKIYVR